MSLFTLVVAPGFRTLEQRPGRPTRELGPGRHRRRSVATYVTVDVRERLDHVAPQEVLTADGIAVKVSAAIRSAVAEPVRYVEQATDPLALVYLAVQVALRDALTGVPVGEAVSAARRTLGPRLTEAADTAGARLGVAVSEVVVKDVVLPADVRAANAEIVTTKQRSAVQLEAARAETAALRSLANAAKLLDDHPALARLRMVQALPYGSKVELTFDD